MGKIAETWRDVRNRSAVQTFASADRETLTEVSELMCGKPNVAGTGWERPPLSLLLYLEADLVKFCFSSKEFSVQLWGSVRSLKDGLLAIEEALCREHCEWKQKKEYENGFTHRSR
jgi:hypothetical protein